MTMMGPWAMMPMLVMLLGGGGGGNELLDYIQTDAYWRAKGVEVSVETLTAELAVEEADDISELIADLGSVDFQTRDAAERRIAAMGRSALPQLEEAADSPNPQVATTARALIARITTASKEAAVRRLMAIRTLGELNDPAAIETLRPLIESDEPFVADYARAAIAAIEDQPHTRPGASHETLMSDAWLLPAKCAIVGQFALPGDAGPVSFRQLFDEMPLPPGEALDQDEIDEIIDEITTHVLMLAEQVGNFRIDAVTVGVSEDIGDFSGFAMVVVRGAYDSVAVREAFEAEGIRPGNVEGLEIYQPEEELAIIIESDERAIVLIGPGREEFPLAETAAALAAGKGQLAEAQTMVDLIDSVDTTRPLWGVIRMTREFRQSPQLAPFETVTFTGGFDEGAMSFELVGKGQDAERIEQAVRQMRAETDAAIAQMREMADFMPEMFEPYIEFMESLEYAADGETATLSGKMDGLTSLTTMFFGMGAMHRHEVMIEPAPIDVPDDEIEAVPVPEDD